MSEPAPQMSHETQTELEAAAFRKLVASLKGVTPKAGKNP